MAVVDCIRLICSAFHDAAELLKQVKTSRGLREDRRHDGGLLEEMQIQDLELSLKRGVSVVQSQYDRDYKRFGAAFANGDREQQGRTVLLDWSLTRNRYRIERSQRHYYSSAGSGHPQP